MRVSTFAAERSDNKVRIDGSAGADTETFAVVDAIFGYERPAFFAGGRKIFSGFDAELLYQAGTKHVIGSNAITVSENVLFRWAKTRRSARCAVTCFTRSGLKL